MRGYLLAEGGVVVDCYGEGDEGKRFWEVVCEVEAMGL